MGAIAGMAIETYAMESAVLRTQKMVQPERRSSPQPLRLAMTRIYPPCRPWTRSKQQARRIIAVVAEGDMLRTQLAILRRLAKHEPFNTIALRQQIAQKVIDRGKLRWPKPG